MKRINNSNKKANWVKSEIPHEAYVCSLCGGACWHYDSCGLVVKSNYCPNCGARMYDETNKDSIELRFKACLEELIDIAKQSESPSAILKIVGDNFLSLAKGFECIKRTKSFEVFISWHHKDILVPLSFGHTELLTDEIWEEYANWCKTDEAKPYLNEIEDVEE